jgi:hypothetical protein
VNHQPVIRLDSAAPADPSVVNLATLLGESPLISFARWVRVYLGAALSAPDGNISNTPDSQLDFTGGWIGEPGGFARAFRASCCDADGVLLRWKDYGPPKPRPRKAKPVEEAPEVIAEPTPPATVETDEPKAPVVTWITPYFDAWAEAYGGDMPIGKNLVTLQKLEEKYGRAAVIERWRFMLSQKKAEFAGAYLLDQAWSQWAPTASAGGSKVEQRAASLHKLLMEHGVLSVAVDGFHDLIDRLVQTGVIRDRARFIAVMQRLDFRKLREEREHFAIKHIIERASDLLA